MTPHVLMTYADRRPYRATPALPAGAQYDSVKGYWTLSGTPLVSSPDFSAAGYITKKCDQETGEDLKGE